MFEIFAGLFDNSLLTLKFTPGENDGPVVVAFYAIVNTLMRAATLGAFTYGAIRVVFTAVEHGTF